MENNNKTAAVLIPVYQPGQSFDQLIQKLGRQVRKPEKIVLMVTIPEGETQADTEKTVKARVEGSLVPVECHFIFKKDFDHGGTRNAGMAFCDTDYVICMTDDAVPADVHLTEELLKPFEEEFCGSRGGVYQGKEILISYGRQLPAANCREAEKYTRAFNYPENSRIKTLEDLETLGIKTFFASNVCAAYRREAFLARGGFPEKTIFNEDMIFAGRAVRGGAAIAYAANARVIHSHNLSWNQQFHRNFDLAVSQAEAPDVFGGVRSEGEGVRLVKKTIAHMAKIGKPWLIPGVIWVSGWKYMGYLLGKRYRKLPKKLVVFCSLNKRYWK